MRSLRTSPYRCGSTTGYLPVGARRRRERGYVMMVSMMILLLIAIATVSMAKSFFLEEGMAGFTREKNRSFAAAMAALRYGEYYAMTHTGTGGACPVSGGVFPAQICINQDPTIASTTINTVPLASYMQAVVPTAYAGISTSGGKDTFYALPGVFINQKGSDRNSYPIYLITAFGYGGSQNSVSIVQSYYTSRCTTASTMYGIAPC